MPITNKKRRRVSLSKNPTRQKLWPQPPARKTKRSRHEQRARQKRALTFFSAFSADLLRVLCDKALLLVLRLQIQSRRIHAVAKPGWSWTILEHMPQMSIAFRTPYLRPSHAVGRVFVLDDFILLRRLIKARPS